MEALASENHLALFQQVEHSHSLCPARCLWGVPRAHSASGLTLAEARNRREENKVMCIPQEGKWPQAGMRTPSSTATG